MNPRVLEFLRASLVIMVLVAVPARAEKHYDPGATDTTIKIGNFMPYSGVFSEYGASGRAEAAYFKMINDQGGINGRMIQFVSLDLGAGEPLALTKRLVEQEQVLLLFGTWGGPMNLAIRPYLNDKKVPQIFVADTNSAMDDPAHFPWTMGFQASKRTESSAYAKYILQAKPNAKIAVLCGGSATDQEWLSGLRDALGSKASTMIVKEITFDYSDPAGIAPKVAQLKDSGADVFMNFAVGRFATEALRQAYDLNWHPLQFIPNASLSIASFLDPAGLQKASGIICNARSKGWLKPQSRQDPAVRAFVDWMHTYNPDATLRDANYVYGYEAAQTLVEVLKKCGDDLTRANVMKQAASLDLTLGMLRPGIRITTSPTDYRPIKQLFLIQFDGHDWVPLDHVIGD